MPKDDEKEETKLHVFPFIEGETIDLVAINSKWEDLFCKWMNDPKVRHYDRNIWPITHEEVKKIYASSPDRHTKNFAVLVIYHKRDQRPIGMAGLEDIDWTSMKANLFTTIGEPDYWGKNIAVEANKLIIEYGFTELNLHKIYAGIYTPNKRSLRVAEKLGFEKEAVLKEQLYVDGVYQDEHKFALFKRDWIKSKQKES
jgi:ribosomal-protein-alanine N-acetyltransferase